MIANPQEMRALSFELGTSTWILAAIGALFESGVVDLLRETQTVDDLAARCPALSRNRIQRCLDVAASAGFVAADGPGYRLADGAMPFLQQPMRAALLGEIRSNLMQPLALLDAARGDGKEAGWRHTDPALLKAQGDASGGFPPMFKASIVAGLGDLGERLDRPGARFLDVGVGVGALSISMCRVWPNLEVVGVDVFDAPLAIARENVARAGLTDRVELRKLAVEELGDEASFDLAWFPGVFVPEQVVAKAIARVTRSLRPGGWLLYPVMGGAGDDRHRSVGALMNELWGGPVLTTADVESRLADAGLASVRTLPRPAPWAPGLVVGQR